MTFAEYPIRFEVLSALSSGGMGRVDVAKLLDVEGEVLIAVKRPHRHMAEDEDFARMFMEEARLTWAIQHPNVARLVGWGRDDESIYMATEYVSGGPLHEISRRGRRAGEPLSENLIAFLIGRAAEGLAGAHGLSFDDGTPANIVHRDISPSNIMVGFDGRVKIIDFGVAKIAQGGNALRTATGVLKGKVPYMAPEYARGGAIDISCDLYSLGVVLYELLAGRRPFSAEHDLELLRKVAEEPPPPLLEEVPGLDPDLAAFVHQLLAKTKAERPASAHAIVTVLDAFLLRRGCAHGDMQRALADYVSRYAQSKSLGTRSGVQSQPSRSSGNGVARGVGGATQSGQDSRGFTCAVSAGGDQHTRVSLDPPSGAGFGAGSAAMSGADPMGGRTPVGTNSALFVPPNAPAKPPVYLWVALGTGLFSLLIAVAALFLVSTRTPPPDAPPAAGARPTAELPPTGPAPTAEATAPVPPSSATATATVAPTTPPPLPTAVPPGGPVKAPPIIKRAACTPSSFDYPRCLKK